jgi:hypothetical protein
VHLTAPVVRDLSRTGSPVRPQTLHTGFMAKVVNPGSLPAPKVLIPGLEPPVRTFVPADDGNPSEVDAFIKMIRELRNQSPAPRTGRE